MKLDRAIDLVTALAVLGILAIGAGVVAVGFWIFTAAR